MKTDESRRQLETLQQSIESGINAPKDDFVILLGKVLGLAVEMMNADQGVILLNGPDGLTNMASHNISKESAESLISPSSSSVKEVLKSRNHVLTHDAQTDPRFEGSESIILHNITSILCVPMFSEDNEIVGVIYLDSRRNRQRFTEENVTFMKTFARMAAIAVDYARDYGELYFEKERIKKETIRSWDLKEIIGKEIIGQSPSMLEVFDVMRRVMNSDISVLLEGESGTGKELVARALHYNGPRRAKPFVAQFCGNLSEELLESELFGHKKGSFTGAISDKKGLFEIADGGTFFLDEIADISPTIQAKLLRVIQEGEIRRVGDTAVHKVDVRIISATNKKLKDEVKAGKFREDLFYRLNVITVSLPPLRDRTGDIPILVKHFLNRFAEKNNTPVRRTTARAMRVLENYRWQGNIRELENTIERATILAVSEKIDVADLLIPRAESFASGRKNLKEVEREVVLKTLEEFGHNKTRTAEVLGVSLRWLHYKLNEWKKKDR